MFCLEGSLDQVIIEKMQGGNVLPRFGAYLPLENRF